MLERTIDRKLNGLVVIIFMLRADESADILAFLANLVAVAAFLGVVLLALFGGLLRIVFIANKKSRSLVRSRSRSKVTLSKRWRLRVLCYRRVKQLSHNASDWSVSKELAWMANQAQTAASAEFPWGEPATSDRYSSELLRYARKIELSSLVRIGSAKLADEEVRRTTQVAQLLARDADFRPAQISKNHSQTMDLVSMGIEVLAGPKWGTKASDSSTSQRPYFDELRVTSHDKDFGAFGPLDQLEMRFGPEHDLFTRQEIETRAVKKGREVSDEYPDSYNGVLPRLRSWRVEASSTGPIRRLHLSVERTTFVTWMVTNGDTSVPGEKDSAGVPVDQVLVAGANHVPISVALVSRDGFIVQPIRASGLAIYPDCFGSAANGNVEIEPRYAMAADLDADGFVDFVGAALRETREELGSGIDLNRDSMRVVALIRYTDNRELSAPVLILQATSDLNFDEIVHGMRLAHPVEGAFEVGATVRGIPTDRASCSTVVPWLVGEHRAGKLTAPGLASTLFSLASIVGPECIAESLSTSPGTSDTPSQVRVAQR